LAAAKQPAVKRTVLLFPTIVELIDFSLSMKVKHYEVNRSRLMMMAEFCEQDIDLAIKAFKAKVFTADAGN
jgi:hypothetical protein